MINSRCLYDGGMDMGKAALSDENCPKDALKK